MVTHLVNSLEGTLLYQKDVVFKSIYEQMFIIWRAYTIAWTLFDKVSHFQFKSLLR